MSLNDVYQNTIEEIDADKKKDKSEFHNDEELKNIQKDYKKMPLCAEKIILMLIYYSNMFFKYKKEPFAMNVQSELNLLHQRLEHEELLSETVEDIYQDIKSFLIHENYSGATSKLKMMLHRLRDLNIQELFRLTQTNDEGIQLIKGRNIHLLIGVTGSGKSTTLHFLGGSKMEIVSLNGQPHIEATKVNNLQLKKVKSKPSINSETRNIIPVIIELDRSQGYSEKMAIFCDSPGFEDTNGPEIDIANSIAIQKAIEVCKGIKPIVVTSKLVGDRFQGLSELSNILSGMFVNFEKDLRYFAYIYTKYPLNETESLRNTLRNIQDELLENENRGQEINKSFLLIIQDMIKKARKNFIVLNPLVDDPKMVISKIVDEDYIENPERRLKISFSYHSKSIIEKQIQKHFSCLEKSLIHHEIDLAIYKLEEIVQLKDLIKQDDINEKFEEITLELFKSLNKDFDSFILRFNKKIDRDDLMNSDDHDEYLKLLTNAQKMQKVIIDY